jgi:hypothetical protein
MFFLPPAVLSSAHTFMMPRRYVKGDFDPWHAYWGSSSPNSPSRSFVLGQCTLAFVEHDLHAELVDVDGGKVLRLRGDGCVPRDYHIHHATNRLHPKGERRGVEHHVIAGDAVEDGCLYATASSGLRFPQSSFPSKNSLAPLGIWVVPPTNSHTVLMHPRTAYYRSSVGGAGCDPV